MSSIMRARSGLTRRLGRLEGIGGSSLEPKVAGPSMLGIGCPDRHALPLTPPKTHGPSHPPSRASGFVQCPISDLRCAPRVIGGFVILSTETHGQVGASMSTSERRAERRLRTMLAADVAGRLHLEFEETGEQVLKNKAHPKAAETKHNWEDHCDENAATHSDGAASSSSRRFSKPGAKQQSPLICQSTCRGKQFDRFRKGADSCDRRYFYV